MGFSKENLEKHLNLYKKVQIAENELNYGSALFAKIPISKNNVICTFDGVLVPKAYIKKKMYDSDYIFEYSVDSKFGFDLDVSDANSCLGRFINDCIDKNLHNCEAIETAETHVMKVKATKHIDQGEQIFISYGEQYWISDQQTFDKLSDDHKDLIMVSVNNNKKLQESFKKNKINYSQSVGRISGSSDKKSSVTHKNKKKQGGTLKK